MTVHIPDQVAVIPEMEVDQGAKAVTDQLRATATKTADVGSWSAENGAPDGWSGDAAEAANHAMTTFSTAVDAVTAAFTTVAAACDAYVSQLAVLAGQRLDMMETRSGINIDIQTLVDLVNSSDVEDEPELQVRADALKARVTRLDERRIAWEARVKANEDKLVAAFRSADTVGEGRALSTSSDRPDVDALNRELEQKNGDPKAINAWWMALTPAEREALKIDNPDAVGNTDGIPVDDRDEANRASMTRDIDRLHGLDKERELTPEEQQLLKNAEAARDALDAGATVTDPSTGLPVDSNLILYQPEAIHGDGAAAVAYGNPDTADNTSVVVPGIMNTMASLGANGESALDLFAQANKADPGASNATIAWIGYDSPDFDMSQAKDPVNAIDMAMVSNEEFAEAGGKRLSAFVDGLRASDTGDQSHLTVIGHSYGSTTVAHAAHDGLAADDLVLLGSPGAGGDAHDVSDLNMGEGHVYVGSRDEDFVTWLGGDTRLGLGEDPSQSSFGADRIDVGNGESFHAEDIGGQGLNNHTSYFDPGSESLENIADITVGNDPETIDGRDQPARDYLTDYAKDEGIYYGNQVYDKYVDPVVDGARDAIDTASDVLENTGRLLSPPMPSFGGMFG
ncbi:hypothetical protein GEV29_15820 [Aeromicrobium sp. SMF47]|uniref:alpha/beta hydrolase n=1 Tax=Aeromicrobium TaxID=2040 RepID=UPI00129E6E98|nr:MULTISPECIES: alpha/beta hydrolase [Aeromicrobium]MRJ78005.1 hypothetical protein [Aeromicrobium yanjiei]MRK02365.1 hypothetical protein [Aeromicrobium sp. S22]